MVILFDFKTRTGHIELYGYVVIIVSLHRPPFDFLRYLMFKFNRLLRIRLLMTDESNLRDRLSNEIIDQVQRVSIRELRGRG